MDTLELPVRWWGGAGYYKGEQRGDGHVFDTLSLELERTAFMVVDSDCGEGNPYVEEGIAPDELLATDAPDATPYRERPIYPYPAVAVYDGTGDPAVASSFSRSE